MRAAPLTDAHVDAARARRDRLGRGVATITVAYTAAYAVLILAMPASWPARALVADAAFLPFHPLAAALLWLASDRDADRGPRWQGFRALAWAQVLGTLNTVVWILSSAGRLPLNSVYFQWLGVLITLLSVVGVARLVPQRPLAARTVAVPWLDIALFALAAASIGWYFVGWPILASGSETEADFAWFAAIASADAFCALLALAAWTYPSERIGRASAAALAVAFGATVWADVIIERASVAGTYQSGGWSDAVFAATIAAVGLVGFVESRRPSRAAERSERAVLTARALSPLVATAAVLVPVALGIASGDGLRALVVPLALAATFVVVLQWRYLLLDREIERTLTARLGLERDLALARQFESLGRYAGSVAHDFNNLLTVLRANTDLLALEAQGRPAVEDPLRAMRDTIGRGATLSRRLLDLTRGEEAPPARLDLAVLTRAVAGSLRDVIPAAVRLHLQLPAREVPVRLRAGDADQLLLNLLVNARDAMPRGGRLDLRLWVDGGQAVLEVEDEGTGIPDEIRARIFEPLFTTKGDRQGTGLGLATVHAVATQAGGSVAVWSEVGRGTRFTVRLPLEA